MLGPRTERESLLAQVWICSPAVHSESGDSSYFGLEVASNDRGLFVSQGRYVKEQLLRHNVTQGANSPCPAWKEAYDDPNTREENPCLQEVRAAQSLVGELMWLSVRARPDMDSSLRGFTDISFGPSAGRSHQGVVVCWSGAPVYWESGRQSLTSLSTAEAELIGLVHGSQGLEAV